MTSKRQKTTKKYYSLLPKAVQKEVSLLWIKPETVNELYNRGCSLSSVTIEGKETLVFLVVDGLGFLKPKKPQSTR